MKQERIIRELMLCLYEVGETLTSFEYAQLIMKALELDQITSEQFNLLSGELQMYCESENIPTSNEICSLF